MANVLAIPDLQEPFSHPDFFDFLKAVRRKYRTTETVNVGDEIDNHTLSDYETDPDGFSAFHELQEAITKLKPYFKAFPKMKICLSNHTGRLLKVAFKAGIPSACIKSFKEIIGAPKGWEWKDEWEIDGVRYIHGMGYSGTMGALNAAIDRHKPCVIGHLHADAGLLFRSNGREVIWGMNVGSGIDLNAYAFKYGKDCRKKPILSCGVILDSEPILIRMKTEPKSGRWTHKL